MLSASLHSLMYHDITAAPAAHRYCLTLEQFKSHLVAISDFATAKPAIPTAPGQPLSGFAITFDDGHPGWLEAGEALASIGWRAIFFVITGRVDRGGGLSAADLRRLAAMGHVMGSHSVDHPEGIAGRPYPFILDQWTRSKAFLEYALGAPVLAASIPGGYYGRNVARAADEAGLRFLFTSEPVSWTWRVGGCSVFGRYVVLNGMSARSAAALAAGVPSTRAGQFAAWNAKKLLKLAMAGRYLALRDRLMPRIDQFRSRISQ